ncbi:alpha/beta hydrolase [Desulfitobacterium hafniense]|uniref:alpha/beta hydrolase n=1 Tax=Desulfitobacterium hafniense TaxID=49338 RepID=UPI000380F4C4|nr:alpha/beta hydrolase [Desulfitobacterium hafniense]
MMTVKRIAIKLAIITALIFLSLASFSFYFYHMVIERKPNDPWSQNTRLTSISMESNEVQTFPVMAMAISPASTELADSGDFSPTEQTPPSWVESQPYEFWTVTSEDGLRLAGYYIPARIPTTRTVIIAHGYRSQALEMGEFAKFYSEKLGYNVLLPDARGYGTSEGDFIGFGWPDRKDYLLWIQETTEKVGPDAQITLHGLSMGGATVMMVSGESLPEQVKVIVEDSGYTSVQDELAYQLKRMYNLPAFPLLPAVSLFTDIKAGYNFSEASSLRQVEKNQTPMLFIHGALDDFVPVEMALQLYDACKAEKKLYLAENAVHGMAFYTDRPAYEAIVEDFIGLFMGH